MFKAQAVFKTPVEGQFQPAGFDVDVEVEPVTTNVMPDSMSLMFGYMRENKCDGFIIDLGNNTKKHVIRG
jgi:hypothetical protein